MEEVMMDALAAIGSRRSTRKFTGKAVPREVLKQIVDAGRLAPTARNEQPWEFVVVTGRDTLAKIGEITDHGKFIAEAAACVAVYCRVTKYYLEDGCAATENILVAATAMGVQSCWVAGDKKPYGSAISELLGVAPAYNLVSLIALGYGDGEPKIYVKRSLDKVLHWEKFQ
jgi:nitroreductase